MVLVRVRSTSSRRLRNRRMTLTTVDVEAYPQVNASERVFATSVVPSRYEPADDVAPRRFYGGEEPVRFTGSTHDERGFITKHAPTIGALNHHLAAKIEDHLDEIELVDPDPEAGAKTLIIGYGVTSGAVRAASIMKSAIGALVM